MKILIASNNKHKIQEIKNILNIKEFPELSLITPAELFNSNFDVDETGFTFQENAEIKAIAFYKHYGIPSLSDDSGLNVDVLNGAPGVLSARYSGETATDKSNRMKLIEEIKKLGYTTSRAHFQCSICFFDGNNILKASGICPGEIILQEKGERGFGYDPLFIPDGYNQTFAELSEEIKNIISHRANALSNFLPIFADYYKKQNLKTK